ncbi:MAG: ABC transporter ATP-binding protein [FCB group bacterium]|jgi:putative ABC transport system ATP-binding protein
MPVLSLRNIELSFQDKTIIKDFNLVLTKGEKVALKGRSGSGKTSILNLIMGFGNPDTGEIKYHDKILAKNDFSRIRKKICWLPQNVNIFGRGKVENIINFPFSFHENKKLKPSKNELESLLAGLNLDTDILNKDFENISGGERQRIGILLCKLLKRELILLDEPTSALDKESIEKMQEMILKDAELTVLSASHDDDWLAYCDRVIDIE